MLTLLEYGSKNQKRTTMYYNTNNQTITNNIPNIIKLSNGTIISGPMNDPAVLADAGYLTVRSDTPDQPENTIEDASQRVVNIDGNFVDIVRTWIPVTMVSPETISARQIRLWLVDNNISLTSVETAINGIVDEKLREKTLVEWEYAPYIERNHPLVEALASSLGLTSEQVDQGFIQASVL
jgi:hypothetical protein